MALTRYATTLALAGGLFAASTTGQAGKPQVEVRVLKLDALKELIKEQKGKVVVVDFWADY
jgi:hypothetical protein